MLKKVLVITTSLRKGGNSELLADEFIKGAQEAGHTVEKIGLYGKTVNFCKGCLACQQTGRCVIRDDMDTIVPKLQKADVLVFATPVYYYEMCGQMKTLLDRSNPLFASDYAYREVYLLAAAADTAASAVDGAKKGLQGWIDCFEGVTLKGVVLAGGVTAAGDIHGNKALKQAQEMGRLV